MLWAGAMGARAEGDEFSANYQMPGCHTFVAKGAVDPLSGYCLGTVSGVWGMATESHQVCAPSDVTSGQAVRVVVQFTDARPARWHEPLLLLALEALTTAWPCGKS